MSYFSPLFILSYIVLCFVLNHIRDYRLQNIIITLFSLVSYALIDGRLLSILLFEILICYFATIFISKYNTNKKLIHNTSIIILLFILFVFKYYNFFVDKLSVALSLGEISSLKLIIPLGISFYTFMGISYISDLYHDKITDSSNILSIAMYLSFFPSITAGPITKARDFFSQINKPRIISLNNIGASFQIIVLGLIKKIVIADRLSVYVDTVYSCPNAYSGLTLFLASLAYSIQLYCDFSGYSDIAIGTAKLMGIELKRNFNMPYISRNISEFWKRWHISLSEWLQEYLYIPLGGNRNGRIRTYFNLMATMILGGLWHGANMTYLIWGVAHGFALVINKLLFNRRSSSISRGKVSQLISMLFTFLFVNACWILFRAQSIGQAFNIIYRIISLSPGINYYYIYFFIFGLMIIISLVIVSRTPDRNSFYPIIPTDSIAGKTLLCIFILLIVVFGYYGNTAFIYAQY